MKAEINNAVHCAASVQYMLQADACSKVRGLHNMNSLEIVNINKFCPKPYRWKTHFIFVMKMNTKVIFQKMNAVNTLNGNYVLKLVLENTIKSREFVIMWKYVSLLLSNENWWKVSVFLGIDIDKFSANGIGESFGIVPSLLSTWLHKPVIDSCVIFKLKWIKICWGGRNPCGNVHWCGSVIILARIN